MRDQRSDITHILPNAGPADGNQRLLIFAFRRIAAGGLNDAHAANALLGAFGLSFRRPLILLRALMAEMSRISNRRLLIAPCCCPRMTASETALLAAIISALGDPHGAHRALGAILGVQNCLGALSSAQALVQAFEDLGRPLPAR